MSKQNILNSIRRRLEQNVSELAQSLETYHTSSDMDESDTRDPEDFSQQSESRDMLLLLQQQVDHANGQLLRLDSFVDKPSTTVEPGAVVETDKTHFFIGLSFPSFRDDQYELIGISSESPAYAAMRGKGEGDSFKLGDHHYTIKQIH